MTKPRRRMKAQPMTGAAGRDLALSTIADALESMQQKVAGLNTDIGICRKLMLLALGGADETDDSEPAIDPDASYEDFDESQPHPTPTGGRNGRR